MKLVVPEINPQQKTSVHLFIIEVLLQLLDDGLVFKINVNHVFIFLLYDLHNILHLLIKVFYSQPFVDWRSFDSLVRETDFK